MKQALKKHSTDNVATVLEDVNKGDLVSVLSNENTILFQIVATESIPFGNKIALIDIVTDKAITKYGHRIGRTSKRIGTGDLVHVHNVRSEKVNFPDAIIDEIIRQMNIKK